MPRPYRLLLVPLFACLLRLWPGRAEAVEAGLGVVEVQLGRPTASAAILITAVDGSWSARVEPRQGRAAFFGVPPGRYRLSVEGEGAAVPGGLTVEAGEVLRLLVSPGRVLEAAPVMVVLDRRATAYGTVFDRDALSDLPSSGDAASLLETVEPVAIADRRDTGGLFPGEPGRASVHGASWTETTVALAGLQVTEPRRGGTGLVDPDLVALQGLAADTAALPVEIGGAGLALTLLPRRPGSSWSGEADADGVVLHGRPPAEGPPAVARLTDGQAARLAVGGPIVRDRLGLFVAGTWRQAHRLEGGDPLEQRSERGWGLGHLVWRDGARQEVRLVGMAQWLEAPAELRTGRSDAPPARTAAGHAQIAWMQRGRTGSVVSAQLAHTGSTRRTPDDVPRALDRLLDGPIPEQPRPGREHAGRTTLQASVDLPPWRWSRSDHHLRGGLALDHATLDIVPSGAPFSIAEALDGLPARIWDYDQRGPTRASSAQLTGYAGDRVTFEDRATLDGGVRLESIRGRAGADPVRIRWVDLAPRFSARVRLTAGGGLHVLGAYGRYLDRLPLSDLAWGDPLAPVADVYRWDDANGDRRFQPGERGPLVARTGPGAPVASLDPRLARPRTDEFLLALEARLAPRVVLRLAGIDREERQLIESVNVGLSPADYRTLFFPDPGGDFAHTDDDQIVSIRERLPSGFGQDRLLLTNPAGHSVRHQGLELTLLAHSDRLRFLFGATAHRSDGSAAYLGYLPDENDPGLVGELFDGPNPSQLARGRLFSDRAYTIKIAGTYHVPNFRAGLVVRYQDGQPFARLLVVPGLGQGADAVRAVPNGRHRFAYTLTLDGRLEADLSVGGAQVGAVLQAFNLLDTASEVEEDVVTGPGFRTVTAVQPPRTVRAGLRVGF